MGKQKPKKAKKKAKATFDLPDVSGELVVTVTDVPKGGFMSVKKGVLNGQIPMPDSLSDALSDLMRRKCYKNPVGLKISIGAKMVNLSGNGLTKSYHVQEILKKASKKK